MSATYQPGTARSLRAVAAGWAELGLRRGSKGFTSRGQAPG